LAGKTVEVTDLSEPATTLSPAANADEAKPLGTLQQAKLELAIAANVEPGVHEFRLQTRWGTSNLGALYVGRLPVIPENEPNDSPSEAQTVTLPATLTGAIGQPGDVDCYAFTGHAGQELVFQVVASSLGSELRSVLMLRDSTGRELARAGDFARSPDPVLTFKLPADGKYMISISDLREAGTSSHFYLLNAGALPYVSVVFPLGVQAGQSTEVTVKGANLGDLHKVAVRAPQYAEGWQTLPLRVKTADGESLNRVVLAVSSEPELAETEPNDSPTQAQPIPIPVAINGHIDNARKDGPADEDYFRFRARKGQRLTIEVAAARLGSALDSVIEVLDARGHDISRATLRSVAENSLAQSDRDSYSPSFEMASLTSLRGHDYWMIGDELVQIARVSDDFDVPVVFRDYRGERLALLGTSPRAHAVNTPMYKVQILDPGQELPPNGLPVFHLTYRNDDGGPGYGEDSRLDFLAPEDGDYLLHLKDARGFQREDFAYCLTIREARPDFTLTAEPANPSVPQGGRVPVVVTANRTLGYEGPIAIEAKGLPKGLAAVEATIPAGQDSTVVILSAGPGVEAAQLAKLFQIEGRANAAGRQLIRVAETKQALQVVSIVPSPELLIAGEPQQIILEPGKDAIVTLHVDRKAGFRGPVACYVLNLPPGVRVIVGTVGVVVFPKETSRTVTLRAEEFVRPLEQPVYVVGTVGSNPPTKYASPPLVLSVRAKQRASAGTGQRNTKH
jgi:hypothetical protein